MPLDFYLTITGLCAIVLKSQQDYPEHPDGVEILFVDAHHHRPVLSYLPKEMDAVSKANYIAPELCVDPKGERLAMLDLNKKIVSFKFGNQPADKFNLSWGDPAKEVPPDETWMNWIAPVQYLGLKGIRVGKDDYIPQGASARLTLPPGTIIAKEIIEDPEEKDPQKRVVVWEFPANQGKKRALANRIIYSVTGANYVQLLLNGKETLVSKAAAGELWMSLSNDMTHIPYDYNEGVTELKHLVHLEDLAKPAGSVTPPKAIGTKHTGKPICNQVLFVDKN